MPKQPPTPKAEDFGFVPDEAPKDASPKASKAEDFGFVPDPKPDGPTVSYKGKEIPIMYGTPTAALVPEEAGANLVDYVKRFIGKPSNVGSTGGLFSAEALAAKEAEPAAEAVAKARSGVPEAKGGGMASAIKRKLFEKAKEYGPTALAIEGGRRAWDWVKDTALD